MVAEAVVLEILDAETEDVLRELLCRLSDHGREAVAAPRILIGKRILPDPGLRIIRSDVALARSVDRHGERRGQVHAVEREDVVHAELRLEDQAVVAQEAEIGVDVARKAVLTVLHVRLVGRLHGVAAVDARRGVEVVAVGVVAVGIADRQCRVHVIGHRHEVQLRRGVAVTGGLHLRVADRRSEMDVLVDLGGNLPAEGIAVEIGVDEDTLLIEVSGREVVGDLLRAAAVVDLVVLRNGRAENLVHPVRARNDRLGVLEIGGNGHARILVGLLAQLGKLLAVEQIIGLLGGLERERGAETHLPRLLAAALRRDEDHTVGTACTVDGRCRGILQHLDRLDIVRAEARERVDDQTLALGHRLADQGHTVDDVQRLVRTVDRARTADADRGAAARLTVVLTHLHTGNLAAQRIVERGNGLVVEQFRLDRSHGSGQVRLLHRTVTNRHDLFERNGILLQDDVDLRAVGHGDLLGLAAEEGVDQHGIGRRDAEGVASVGRGGRTAGRALLHDRGADNGLGVGVGDDARDLVTVLGPHSGEAQQQQADHDGEASEGPASAKVKLILFHGLLLFG